MLADDFLGQGRERLEDPLPESYLKAFREIDADPNNELIVAVLSVPPAVAGRVMKPIEPSYREMTDASEQLAVQSIVGTLQLVFSPSISYQGGKRCTVESVRVDTNHRRQGIGRRMMLWAIERAKEKGCISMQLTTNNDRTDAHRFYEGLGFSTTHVGMKLKLK